MHHRLARIGSEKVRQATRKPTQIRVEFAHGSGDAREVPIDFTQRVELQQFRRRPTSGVQVVNVA
jgi:hypothetical protein